MQLDIITELASITKQLSTLAANGPFHFEYNFKEETKLSSLLGREVKMVKEAGVVEIITTTTATSSSTPKPHIMNQQPFIQGQGETI